MLLFVKSLRVLDLFFTFLKNFDSFLKLFILYFKHVLTSLIYKVAMSIESFSKTKIIIIIIP